MIRKWYREAVLTEKELLLRKSTIGSSDVPAIVGTSPFKNGGHVLEAKLDPKKVMEERPFKIGHKMERPIAELALEFGDLPGVTLVNGWTVVKDGWMSATPDFYLLKSGNETYRRRRPLPPEEAFLVEVKCVGWRMLSHWDWGKKVPDFVTDQVQWQMEVLGHEQAFVVAFLGAQDVVSFLVEKDEVRVARLKKRCRRFWEEHLAEDKRDKIWARVKLEKLRARMKKVA